jgi:membrane protein implicated in regulation of membrane protease activity
VSAIRDLLPSDPAILWASVGMLLLIVEVLATQGFFISFAVAAFLVALLTWAGLAPEALMLNIVIFAGLGVVLIPVSRRLLRKLSNRTPDINKY